MPVYLFTFHAYRSWMPDRSRGFLQRGKGILPTNNGLARAYAHKAKATPIVFNSRVQRLLVDVCQQACQCKSLRLHAVATDPSHCHILLSWRVRQPWGEVRRALKAALSRRLNAEVKRQAWFSRGGSRKRVADRAHFDFLLAHYLPKHRGWKWDEKVGAYRLTARRS